MHSLPACQWQRLLLGCGSTASASNISSACTSSRHSIDDEGFVGCSSNFALDLDSSNIKASEGSVFINSEALEVCKSSKRMVLEGSSSSRCAFEVTKSLPSTSESCLLLARGAICFNSEDEAGGAAASDGSEAVVASDMNHGFKEFLRSSNSICNESMSHRDSTVHQEHGAEKAWKGTLLQSPVAASACTMQQQQQQQTATGAPECTMQQDQNTAAAAECTLLKQQKRQKQNATSANPTASSSPSVPSCALTGHHNQILLQHQLQHLPLQQQLQPINMAAGTSAFSLSCMRPRGASSAAVTAAAAAVLPLRPFLSPLSRCPRRSQDNRLGAYWSMPTYVSSTRHLRFSLKIPGASLDQVSKNRVLEAIQQRFASRYPTLHLHQLSARSGCVIIEAHVIDLADGPPPLPALGTAEEPRVGGAGASSNSGGAIGVAGDPMLALMDMTTLLELLNLGDLIGMDSLEVLSPKGAVRVQVDSSEADSTNGLFYLDDDHRWCPLPVDTPHALRSALLPAEGWSPRAAELQGTSAAGTTAAPLRLSLDASQARCVARPASDSMLSLSACLSGSGVMDMLPALASSAKGGVSGIGGRPGGGSVILGSGLVLEAVLGGRRVPVHLEVWQPPICTATAADAAASTSLDPCDGSSAYLQPQGSMRFTLKVDVHGPPPRQCGGADWMQRQADHRPTQGRLELYVWSMADGLGSHLGDQLLASESVLLLPEGCHQAAEEVDGVLLALDKCEDLMHDLSVVIEAAAAGAPPPDSLLTSLAAADVSDPAADAADELLQFCRATAPNPSVAATGGRSCSELHWSFTWNEARGDVSGPAAGGPDLARGSRQLSPLVKIAADLQSWAESCDLPATTQLLQGCIMAMTTGPPAGTAEEEQEDSLGLSEFMAASVVTPSLGLSNDRHVSAAPAVARGAALVTQTGFKLGNACPLASGVTGVSVDNADAAVAALSSSGASGSLPPPQQQQAFLSLASVSTRHVQHSQSPLASPTADFEIPPGQLGSPPVTRASVSSLLLSSWAFVGTAAPAAATVAEAGAGDASFMMPALGVSAMWAALIISSGTLSGLYGALVQNYGFGWLIGLLLFTQPYYLVLVGHAARRGNGGVARQLLAVIASWLPQRLRRHAGRLFGADVGALLHMHRIALTALALLGLAPADVISTMAGKLASRDWVRLLVKGAITTAESYDLRLAILITFLAEGPVWYSWLSPMLGHSVAMRMLVTNCIVSLSAQAAAAVWLRPCLLLPGLQGRVPAQARRARCVVSDDGGAGLDCPSPVDAATGSGGGTAGHADASCSSAGYSFVGARDEK